MCKLRHHFITERPSQVIIKIGNPWLLVREKCNVIFLFIIVDVVLILLYRFPKLLISSLENKPSKA